MRGDIVIGRLCEASAKKLTVWAEHKEAVEVTTPELFDLALVEGTAPLTICLSKRDVFEYRAGEYEDLIHIDWTCQKTWTGSGDARS